MLALYMYICVYVHVCVCMCTVCVCVRAYMYVHVYMHLQLLRASIHVHTMYVSYPLIRIRSVPGKRTCPVSSSAMMHPTDHMSTRETETGAGEVLSQSGWTFRKRC